MNPLAFEIVTGETSEKFVELTNNTAIFEIYKNLGTTDRMQVSVELVSFVVADPRDSFLTFPGTLIAIGNKNTWTGTVAGAVPMLSLRDLTKCPWSAVIRKNQSVYASLANWPKLSSAMLVVRSTPILRIQDARIVDESVV